MELKTKLRKAELSIERLQENHRSLMPTISKLESDVAVAIASARIVQVSHNRTLDHHFSLYRNSYTWIYHTIREEKKTTTIAIVCETTTILFET